MNFNRFNTNGFTFNKRVKMDNIFNNKILKHDDFNPFNSNVSSDYNKIRFWDEVTGESCQNLIENIKNVENQLTNLKNNYNIEHDNLPYITIYINSPGGSVHDALAVVDYIKNSQFKFRSVIEGCAASAATMISVVCHDRQITENAMVLIHELSSCSYGKMNEIEINTYSLKKLMDMIINIYLQHTEVNQKYLKKILRHDIYWSAQEALKLKIVDSIINNSESFNEIKLNKKEDELLKKCIKKSKKKFSSKNMSIKSLMGLEEDDDDEEEDDDDYNDQSKCKDKGKKRVRDRDKDENGNDNCNKKRKKKN